MIKGGSEGFVISMALSCQCAEPDGMVINAAEDPATESQIEKCLSLSIVGQSHDCPVRLVIINATLEWLVNGEWLWFKC